MISHFRIILLTILIFALPMSAQNLTSGHKTLSNASNAKTEEVKPGSAWTLSFPLGLHIPSDIDTLTYNYQRRALPDMVSDAYATTGNLGAEGINMIYFQRPQRNDFFFDDALYPWLITGAKQKNYNVFIPTTIVSYIFAGTRDNHTDRLKADFAGNVNRRIGVGAFADYLYSKGCYQAQATKDFSFGANVYYMGDRYEMQTQYSHFNLLNKENGGITNDLYITDPAQLQGGVSKIDAKSIPVNLTAAHSRLNGDELMSTHTLKLGYWKQEEVNDTLTRDVYVPVTRFIYSFNYSSRHHFFINTSTYEAQNFWRNFYMNPDRTSENTYMRTFTNALGVEMIEGFRKWVKFGLSAYAMLETRKYIQATAPDMAEILIDENDLTPLPTGYNIAPVTSQNRLFVGGNISKQHGSILTYNANVKFGLTSDAAGDVEAAGNLRTRFRLFADSVQIDADVHFQNHNAPYLLQNYVSNHFVWQNKFGATRSLRAGGSLLIPWTNTRLSAHFENMQNYIYFNAEALPQQYSGNVQIVAAALQQNLSFGIWNWDNTVTFQTSSNQNILPLPKLAVYSNMYLKFTAFKVLKCQLGVDCDYYTSYNGLQYQPATMIFHVQDAENAVKVGNFPVMNLYATFRLYKVRFYAMFSHLNQGWFTKNYFSLPHYPINPRRFQLGLSVDFPN